MKFEQRHGKLRKVETQRKLSLAKLTMLLKLKTTVNLYEVFRRPGNVFRMVNELLFKI
jgi:hypothetical protein